MPGGSLERGAKAHPVRFKDDEMAGQPGGEFSLFQEACELVNDDLRHGIVGQPQNNEALKFVRRIIADVAKSTSRVTTAAPMPRAWAAISESGAWPNPMSRACSPWWPRVASKAGVERGILASTRKRTAYAGSR